ncbi:MAG: universal stress protein [Chitinophagaceae bacterium]|nr:universal stress protein [Chitinophagaceae bacterium]
MKNVLIPTDFTPESLQLINQIPMVMQGERCNVILFHAFDMPSNEMDLIFIGRERIYKEYLTEAFRAQCKKIRNLHFDAIAAICVKCMYGNNVRVFRNFAEANAIDLIMVRDNLDLAMPHKYSIHPVSILKKSGIPVILASDVQVGKVAIFKRDSYQLTKF